MGSTASGSAAGCIGTGAGSRAASGIGPAPSESRTVPRRVGDAMGCVDRARRERPSRRLSCRPRLTARKVTPSCLAFASCLPRLPEHEEAPGLARHGRRVAAPFLALATCAVLALPAPAAAQMNGDGSVIWEATLSVKNIAGSGQLGCANGSASQKCSTRANLSDDRFTYDGRNYSVVGLVLQPDGRLTLTVDISQFTSASDSLTLLVGTSHRFHLGDATGNVARTWNNSGLSWSVGDTIRVKLVPFSTDATLSGLTVQDHKYSSRTTFDLIQRVSGRRGFNPAVHDYRLAWGRTRSGTIPWVEVIPVASDPNARVEYLDPSGNSRPGAQPPRSGGRVLALDYSVNTIVLKVTAVDGVTTKTYEVEIRRQNGQPAEPGSRPQGATLGAEFFSPPERHNGRRIRLSLIFDTLPISNQREITDKQLETRFEVTGGTLERVNSVDGSSTLRHVVISQPSGTVTVTLTRSDTCGDPDSLCTLWGTGLPIGGVTVEIPGPASAPATAGGPLTASFEDAPASHDGVTPFTVGIRFNETPHGADGELTDEALQAVIGVANGTVTSVARVDGNGAHRRVTIAPEGTGAVTVSLAPATSCDEAQSLCTAAGGQLETLISLRVQGPGSALRGALRSTSGTPFTASFENAPEAHDGASAFRVEIRFSKQPKVWNKRLRTILQESITGGTVETAGRVDQEDALRRYADIAPDGDGPVTLSLGPGPDCEDPLGVCTQDGEPLSAKIALEIPGPEAAATAEPPLTAQFENVPAMHDGKSKFELRLVFSAPVLEGSESDRKRALRRALAVSGGTLKNTPAAGPDAFDAWRVRVQPSGHGPVTVSLGPTTSCNATGAVCTAEGQGLSSAIAARIEGPPGLSVADARVDEGPDAAFAFAVTLDRAVGAAVTVDYATANGTAHAGSDYEAANGTLAFAAGEMSKTVEVTVLDDAHDEGEETMTLRLSNPSGAYLADDEATGTIENTDLMPKAWLARFGRTVAEQVLDAVDARLRAAPRSGLEVTVAGRRLGGGALDAAALEAAEEKARLADLSAWLQDEACRDGSGAGADCTAGTRGQSRAVTGRDLLAGSRFALTGGTPGGGFATLWGRGVLTRFDGREGELDLDGEVASVMLGTDWARGRWSAGLLLNHVRGEGGYSGDGSGDVESTLTGLYPWGRYAMTDRVSVWGTAGYGSGKLTLTPQGQEPLETDMDLALAVAGLRGVVVAAPAEGGPELAVKTDALAVRTSADAVTGAAGGNLAATEADVTRLRLGLEGTWRGLVLGTGTFTPRLELGVRRDGGDAETGFGLDLGAGIAWSDPATGIRAEARGRGLLTHEADGLRQRGIAGSFGWDPSPDTDRGPSLTFTQTMGLSATGGADALLGRRTLAGLAATNDGDELDRRRLEVRLGYGFGALGNRFTSRPEAGYAVSEARREYSLVWRLVRDRRHGDVGSLEFAVEARRQGSGNDNGDPEHRLGLGMTARW